MKKQVTFYFDFLSPFSFFAWQRLKRWEQQRQIKVLKRPVVLAKLLSHWGQKAPAEIDPKREYLFRSCLRYAKKNQITFCAPKTHPFNPLYALRMATLSAAQNDQYQVIDSIFRAGWEQGLDLGDPDALQYILASHELPAQDLYERSFSKEAKLELKNNIKQAIEYGAFGVPTMVVDEELYWGNDSLDDINKTLDGEDLLDRQLYEHCLASVPKVASAQLNL